SGAVEWVIISYLIVIAGVLLTVGRLADMVGRKTLWIVGLVVFTLGSATCGAAPTLLILILARAFQGLGGALIMSVSPAMLTGAFPDEERGRALGINAIFVALGVSIGPTLGGLITQSLTWRWIFYVNVPLGILGIICAALVLKEHKKGASGRFDPAGALLLAAGLVALTLGLSFGQEWGWSSPALIATLVVCVVALILLGVVERRVVDPILDFALLRNRVFFSANVSLILSNLALFTVSFMLPFYLEELRGLQPGEAGLLLTPLPLTIAVIAPFSGALADRIGSRWLAAGGLLIACVGLLLLSQINAQSSLPDIIWRLIFTGVGQAIFQSPNNSALMGAAPRHQQGSASGFLATSRVMGQSVSVALSGAIFVGLGGALAGATLIHLSPGAPLAASMTLQNTFTVAFHSAFIVCAIVAGIGVLTSLVRGKEQVKRK
ncbi:MAG: MFS transporter, partial [Ktedonobacteraceae bacterium]